MIEMNDREPFSGPLSGVTILELAGLGALPFGTLKLADMGADVIRINRIADVPEAPRPASFSEFDRGRRSIAIDLKSSAGIELVLSMCEGADAICEAFRPGVAERLGLGPDVVFARNARIVYGRLTGWGQDGPLSHTAAHSLNYEAMTGAIGSIGPVGGPPVPLLQVLGDFAGGGLHLAYGVVCALFNAQRTGHGQVVDAAMTDGVASIYSVFYSMSRAGMHTDDIGTNLFDGGAPFYNVYETADGRYVTVAPIEPHFYALLLEKIGIDPSTLPSQYDQSGWPSTCERFASVFRTKTRDEWCAILEGTDACFAPVLRLSEAHEHHHNAARSMFIPTPGNDPDVRQVAPAPRFSRTPGAARPSYAYPGSDTDEVLHDLGVSAAEIAELRRGGVIA